MSLVNDSQTYLDSPVDNLEALLDKLETVSPTLATNEIRASSITFFVRDSLYRTLVNDPDLDHFLNHRIPDEVRTFSESNQETEEETGWYTLSVEDDALEDIEFFLDGGPDPFPAVSKERKETLRVAVEKYGRFEWNIRLRRTREEILHQAWQRLRGMPAFQQVLAAYHTCHRAAILNEQRQIEKMYRKYREAHPCPAGWSESLAFSQDDGDLSVSVQVVFESADHFVDVRLSQWRDALDLHGCVFPKAVKASNTEWRAIVQSLFDGTPSNRNVFYYHLWADPNGKLCFDRPWPAYPDLEPDTLCPPFFKWHMQVAVPANGCDGIENTTERLPAVLGDARK